MTNDFKTKTEHECIFQVNARVLYAARSFSIELMHEAHGYLEACADLGIISSSNYTRLSGQICRDWLNNGRWTNECDRLGSDILDTREEIRMQILKDKGVI